MISWLRFLFAADIISTVEFNHSGELLATGDKGGRVVIFQQEPEVIFNASQSRFKFIKAFQEKEL